MIAAQTWKNAANFEPDDAIAFSVRVRRLLGMKQPHALEDTAFALGITPRKARSFLRGEPASMKARYRAFLAAWWLDMDRQASALIAEAETIKRAAEQRLAAEDQYVLDLEEPRCSEPPQRKPCFGLGGGFHADRVRPTA